MWMERLNSWMMRTVLTWLMVCLFLFSGTTGLARHSRQTQNDDAILTRVSNLERSLITDRVKIDSIQKELSEIKSRLDALLSTMAAERPAYDDEFIKSYVTEIITNSLESIQNGLISEKQQRLQLENVASDIKDSDNKQDARIRDLEQTCLTKPTTSSTPGKQSNGDEDVTPSPNPSTVGSGQVSGGPISKHVIRKLRAKDCWDLKTKYNISEDGVYEMVTPDGHSRSLRCDMTSDGGGWTVFQRRGDGSVTFNLDWVKYRSFFGNLAGEYWMGNDFLYESTRNVDQTLRVDICEWDRKTRWGQYRVFSVGAAQDKYPLHIDGYTGNAGNALSGGKWGSAGNLNGSLFSTGDQDNDKFSSGSCAAIHSSGWWFNNCFTANLNGAYQSKYNRLFTTQGIQWWTWKKEFSFKGSEMKMRPSSAIPSSVLQSFSCPVI